MVTDAHWSSEGYGPATRWLESLAGKSKVTEALTQWLEAPSQRL